MIEKILLVGMAGAGKTTVGTALCARLGWPYVDNDVLLERTAGDTAARILAEQGEAGLRIAESRVLTVLLALPGPVVCGIPAGVVLDPQERLRLLGSGSHIVWLRASPVVLARRVAGGSGRARPDDDQAAAQRALVSVRHPFYEQLASQVIDVDALPVGAIAKAIMAAVEESI